MLVSLPYPFPHRGNQGALKLRNLLRPHEWYKVREKSKDSTSFFCPQFNVLWWHLQSLV